MVFSSAIFLWLFLPVVFAVNYILPKKYSNGFLLAASLFFYAWGEPVFVCLMLFVIMVSWLAGMGVRKYRSRLFVVVGVVLDLSVLGYYKYAGFFAQTINRIIRADAFTVPMVMLPIGISFFTFQAISFVVDVYRGDVEEGPTFIGTALYISFFPQLIAGPIIRYKDISRQIESRVITKEGVAAGFRRFLYGLSKKVLIANTLGFCVDTIYGRDLGGIGGLTAWIAAVSYTFQIYYDFSGYSDMAIGLGKMFGFDIRENFDYPYLSTSVSEFWRRWHISLGTWFREYVYIPLGGNRKGKVRTYLNLMAVFFLTGLWHGASVRFVLWGLYHGFFQLIERAGLGSFLDRHRRGGGMYCFLTVHFGWVLFRANGTLNGLRLIKRMLLPWLYPDTALSVWTAVDLRVILAGICAVVGAGMMQKLCPEWLRAKWIGSIGEGLYCGLLLVLCLASIATDTYNPFIYFQF